MTKITVRPLGREIPYQLTALHDDTLLVSFQDGFSLFQGLPAECRETTVVRRTTDAVALVGENLISAEGSTLHLWDGDLNLLSSAVGEGEEITGLLAVGAKSLLALDEDSRISHWELEGQELIRQNVWPVECQPLFALGAQKVVCAERGRLQERDLKSGTVLKTWPLSATSVWGISDRHGQHALSLDQDGQAHLWALNDRALMLEFELDFLAVRGYFDATGLRGALLGESGEVATFRITDGGRVNPVEVPATPLVSLAYLNETLHGVDENGGLWRLTEEQFESVGGAWAGWATSLTHRSGKVFVGTATGSVEVFGQGESNPEHSFALHQDAVLGLEWWQDDLLSVGAEATVFRVVKPLSRESARVSTVFEQPGRAVVSYSLCPESGHLWLALDEGLVCWVSLRDGEQGEFQLAGRRIEEIRAAGPGAASLLTDRGSVRHLRLEE